MKRIENAIIDYEYSPPPVIDEISLGHKILLTVRDDLLPAGTKQRAAIPYIHSMMKTGVRHFAYPSPFSGFAQVALAHATLRFKKWNADCTIFCEKTPEGRLHEFTILARNYGATIIPCKDLLEAQERSLSFCSNTPNAVALPLGFNDPNFKDFFEEELKPYWKSILNNYKISELWLPIGSGTLLQTFKKFVSSDINIYGVNVNVLPETDGRIKSIMQDDGVTYIKSIQNFHDACSEPLPPIPSNKYYDAKLFTIIQNQASDRALWWNVAR